MGGLYLRLAMGLAVVAIGVSLYWWGHSDAIDEMTEKLQAQLYAQSRKNQAAMLEQMERSELAVRNLYTRITELTKEKDQAKEEVLRYANNPAKKCVVSPELHRSFDRVTQLHDADPPQQPVSPADQGPRKSDAEGTGGSVLDGGVRGETAVGSREIDDTVTLFAYGDLAERYARCAVEKNALIDWEDDRYANELKAAGRLVE